MRITVLPNLPLERFQRFHASFEGGSYDMWSICAQCGGRCEHQKIGTLMPGEKAFIASELGLSISEVEARYLDRLVTPRGTVDILKLRSLCPFLDSGFGCSLATKKIKPVLCTVYPVVFEVCSEKAERGKPELIVRFLLDELDCPLMHAASYSSARNIVNRHWQKHRHYFETTGIEKLREVGAPAAWYWIVTQYDSENFDDKALERLRKLPVDHYETFTLEALLSCRISRRSTDLILHQGG